MPFLQNNLVSMTTDRSYNIYIPETPVASLLPAIFIFHGAGQAINVIESRWGLPLPVPPQVENYMLVFLETDPTLTDAWVQFQHLDRAYPTHDLDFVQRIITEVTTMAFATGDPVITTVSADPNYLYAAGFSSGGQMVWQLAYSTMAAQFRGYAAVGMPLEPAKRERYRSQLGLPPGVPLTPAVPLIFIMGTADFLFTSPRTLAEVPIETTYPYYSVAEMMNRNGIPAGAISQTQLLPGTTNSTEVVRQLFTGGMASFACITVINGGHNWPSPTTVGNPPVATHINATSQIIDFWQNHASLP